MAIVFTPANRPAGYDQTQKRFSISGLLTLSGNYTILTGIPVDFSNTLNSSGTQIVLPPTYTGPNGPGQGVPLTLVGGAAGYTFYWDSTNKSIRIWNGTTEVATGTIPAALTAAASYCTFTWLRG